MGLGSLWVKSGSRKPRTELTGRTLKRPLSCSEPSQTGDDDDDCRTVAGMGCYGVEYKKKFIL